MLKKENVYINLRGKTEEELTELQNILIIFNEPTYRKDFKSLYNDEGNTYLFFDDDEWITDNETQNKQEITIEQLKEILQPMGGFTPIAMKCTQEQFEAIKPKLRGFKINSVTSFFEYPYLVNHDNKNMISNIDDSFSLFYKTNNVHEEWNEEIFLKACGIEVETLEQQLEKAEAEVKRLKKVIEEDNKPKINDWVYNKEEDIIYQKSYNIFNQYEKKITDQELINKLNELIK